METMPDRRQAIKQPAASAPRGTFLEQASKAGDRARCRDGLGALALELRRALSEIG